jgi:hypothetical protein
VQVHPYTWYLAPVSFATSLREERGAHINANAKLPEKNYTACGSDTRCTRNETTRLLLKLRPLAIRLNTTQLTQTQGQAEVQGGTSRLSLMEGCILDAGTACNHRNLAKLGCSRLSR